MKKIDDPQTDAERLQYIQKKVRNIEIIHAIGVFVLVSGFLGILSFSDLLKRIHHHK